MANTRETSSRPCNARPASSDSGTIVLFLRCDHGEVRIGQVHYYADALLKLHGSVVKVHVDRYDICRVFAQVDGSSIECPVVDLPQKFRPSSEQIHAARTLDQLMDEIARTHYETSPVRTTGKDGYRHLVARCQDEGVEPVSYSTWMRYLRSHRQPAGLLAGGLSPSQARSAVPSRSLQGFRPLCPPSQTD